MDSPDSLFSDLASPSESPAPVGAVEDATMTSLADDKVELPTQSNSTAPAATSAPGPAFVPRAIKRTTQGARRPVATALPANVASAVASSSNSDPSATSRRAGPSAATGSTETDPDTLAAPPKKLSRAEHEYLEAVLSAIETAFSDYGLSVHGKGALLDRFVDAQANEKECWIHISQLLQNPAIRALTGSITDIQHAIKLRESDIVQVHASGYQLGRKDAPDTKHLTQMEPADWDDLILYLENIPSTAATSSDRSLSRFLSAALETPVQRLVLPALFDPASRSRSQEDDSVFTNGGQSSQAQAFAQSRGGPKKGLGLPKGGGPFRGFAFVVVRSAGEAQRILTAYPWKREKRERSHDAGNDEVEEEAEGPEAEGETAADPKGKGKAKKEKLSPAERAKRGGMRSLTYAKWLDLKREYFAYRHTIESLLDARAHEAYAERTRRPNGARDPPPHLASNRPAAAREIAQPREEDSARRPKRAASPSSPPPPDSTAGPAPSTADHGPKRQKRASSPATAFHARVKRLRTPSPGIDLSSDAALDVQGAYPEGCVLWIRNVHESSTRTTLKALFGALLDQLQEGSSKGVEFVDYEKGLDTCHLRFSSPGLAVVMHDHLTSSPSLHLSQTILTPAASLSPTSLAAATTASRRPLISTKLQGEEERRYWANVPEATRRAARKAAGAKVGLLKDPRSANGAGEEEQSGRGAGGGGGGGGRGRGKNRRKGGAAKPAPVAEKASVATAADSSAPVEAPTEPAAAEASAADAGQAKKRKRPSRM